MVIIYFLFPASLLIFSAFIRLNFWPFVDTFGLYQGDWWYFYHHYGQYIAHDPFFPIEYPVGYVIIQKIAYFISLIFGGFTYENFILANALIFIPLGLTVFVLLDKIATHINLSKRFFLYFVLSPTFFIASTTNYDLMPATLTLLACLLLIKDKTNTAFFILALGTVVKIYPGFLLPLFLLYIFNKKSVFIPLIIFLSTVLLINLPFALYDFKSWVFPYAWQMQNPQRYDFNTISYYLTLINLDKYRIYLTILLLTISWAISFYFYLKGKLNTKNFLLLCFFVVFTAAFGNHVNTPQYLLWFLPFVALFQIPKLKIWWPIDFINASVLFSYFKLHNDFPFILNYVFHFQVFAFIFIYLLLIYYLKSNYGKN